MPELSIVSMQQCTTHKTHGAIGGYRQSFDSWTGYHCSCKGFQFHKSCKHIKEFIETNHCYWHEQYSEKRQTVEQADKMICPACGGKTEWVRVGV